MTLRLYPPVAVVSAGFLAVVLYRLRWPAAAIRLATGVRLGALSGLLWFFISSIFEALAMLFLHAGPQIRDELIKGLDQAASQAGDPQAVAMFQQLKTPSGLEILMVSGLILAFLASIVLGIIGGSIGGALLGRHPKS